MDGKIVVIDYETMMNDHVPSPEHEPCDADFQSSFKFKFNFKSKAASESKFYEHFAKAINNGWLKGTNFKVVVTSATPDPSDPTKQRVDLVIYTLDSAPGDGDPANWSAIELSIEVKLEDVSDDPFDENAVTFQPSSTERKNNLGQVLSYSSILFENRQRTHQFSLVILGQCARIVRWDRAGALVSEKFNYVEQPWMLGRFLWRFARMSAAQRGHDTTATRVLTTSDEYRLMRERADVPQKNAEGFVVNEHARLLFKESVRNSSAQWWKLRIDDSAGPRFFLVGEPHFQASGLPGRATRGYVAVDLADPRGALVFLKDAWRVAHAGIEREGNILRYLNEKAVSRVPTLVCHGDVRMRKDERAGEDEADIEDDHIEDEEDDVETESEDEGKSVNDEERPCGRRQQTVSQKYWTARETGAQCPMKIHRHYRIVVREVGLPMSHFKNAKELVYLLARGISAHDQAYQAGILHRDISAGNVLIQIKEVVKDGKLVRTRDVLLTDWELSKRLDQSDAEPRQPDRTGTWQFMSANALSNPWRVIGVEDEMESFFHLLLFYAIRYLPHNCKDVGMFMEEYFDGFTKENGKYFCGLAKLAAVKGGSITLPNQAVQLVFYLPAEAQDENNPGSSPSNAPSAPGRSSDADRKPHPINVVLDCMLEWLHAQYSLINEQQDPTAGPLAGAPPPPEEQAEEAPTEEEMWFIDEYDVDFTDPARKKGTVYSERAKLEELAANLKEHRHVVSLFGRVWSGKALDAELGAWPRDDKVPDQLRPDFRPDRDPEHGPALGSKRASLHGGRDAASEVPPPTKRRSTRNSHVG
uniref:Amidohydrolase family protein n=1 Tax=Ganoderma boninense TaxID=34458 RepID=A0A5K1JUV8_9APHY|nr:Amidohydrolase family protein [Ganoderma boninense]